MKHFLSHRKVFDSYAPMPTGLHICYFTIDGCNLAWKTSVCWSSFTQRHHFLSWNGNIVKRSWVSVGLMQISVINIRSGLTYKKLCVRWEWGRETTFLDKNNLLTMLIKFIIKVDLNIYLKHSALISKAH